MIGAALATKAGSEDALDEAVLKAVPDPSGARGLAKQTATSFRSIRSASAR